MTLPKYKYNGLPNVDICWMFCYYVDMLTEGTRACTIDYTNVWTKYLTIVGR